MENVKFLTELANSFNLFYITANIHIFSVSVAKKPLLGFDKKLMNDFFLSIV